jgi:FAD binding domain
VHARFEARRACDANIFAIGPHEGDFSAFGHSVGEGSSMTPTPRGPPHPGAGGNQAGRQAWDAIVIGSGAGGSTIALRLAQHGAKTLVVERGDFFHLDPPDKDAPDGRYLYDLLALGAPLNFVGGQTKFYGAALYRFRESDFRAVEHACGTSPAWPFGL